MGETIGQRLRRLRDEHGLSIEALSQRVGCSHGAIRQIESGAVKSPSLELGVKLANALDVTGDYLAFGDCGLEARFAAIEERVEILERWRASTER